MTQCTSEKLIFKRYFRQQVVADFNGGEITSDAGALLLREADQKLGLTEAISSCFVDPRQSGKVKHSITEMIRQRVYGIALGYEDLNDHDTLRDDELMKLVVESKQPLASAPTLCRFENWVDRETLLRISEIFVTSFMASFDTAPEELVLDFDATDDEVHGMQECRFFHGYYDSYCFLPLYVFCGKKLLAAYLRPSKIDAAKHSWAILSLLVKRLRGRWPGVRIIIRGDSGFARWRMMRWCDLHGVNYIIGLAKNERLKAKSAGLRQQAAKQFERTGRKQRLFGEFRYAAHTWDRQRRVIVKAEHSQQGENPRYIVTNLDGDAQELYDNSYCARGEMENRIKEQQKDLFADRTSAHKFVTNQLRVLLASAAYILLEYVRSEGLCGTELAKAQCGTIRLKLLKIGARIVKSVRRVVVHLATGYPYRAILRRVLERLRAAPARAPL